MVVFAAAREEIWSMRDQCCYPFLQTDCVIEIETVERLTWTSQRAAWGVVAVLVDRTCSARQD